MSAQQFELKNPLDLFIYNLSDQYSAEQINLKELQKMAKEVKNQEAKQAIEEHERETRQQIDNLDQVFTRLGAQPLQITCKGMEGIKQESESTKKYHPSEEMKQLSSVGDAAKVEHYEIGNYSSLVTMAKQLGQSEAEMLLLQNLHQEQSMLKKLDVISERLAKQAVSSRPELMGSRRATAVTGEERVMREVHLSPGQEVVIEP